MAHRPLGHLRNLPRGAGGSHRRAATEKAMSPEALAKVSKRSFPDPYSFLPNALLNWLRPYSRGILQRKVPFPKPSPADIRALPETTTIAIAGDWGTGTEEAARIAELMEQDACDYTIHLGDVYYVGDESSIKENCEGKKEGNYTPVRWPRGRFGTFALNGNHEAYARDGAYFNWIRHSLRQQSSCFVLYSEHWLLLGLDTGYYSVGIPWIGWLAEHFGYPALMPSCRLPQETMDWLRADVQPLLNSRGIVILSHHQYFSSFDNEYRNAARQLASIDSLTDRPVLWLWGHEHRLAAYDLFGEEGMKAYGRCLGHGGMPVDRGNAVKRSRPLQFYDDRSYEPEKVAGEPEKYSERIVKESTEFGVNGYALLSFSGPNLGIGYRDISGQEIVRENWSAEYGHVRPTTPTILGRTVQLTADHRLIMAD